MADTIYATSWVAICNIALTRIGTATITDLSDGTNPNAYYCNELLPNAIEEVLGDYDWNCSRKRVSLAHDIDAPAFGYDYQYTLPVDYLRIIEADTGEEPYTIESGKILTNSDTLNLIYIYRPESPTELTAGVRNAIAKVLAFLLTTPISSSEQLSARVQQEAMYSLERAKIADANENKEEEGVEFYEDSR